MPQSVDEVPSIEIIAAFWNDCPDALVVVSKHGTVLHANSSCRRRLGDKFSLAATEFDELQCLSWFPKDDATTQRRLVHYCQSDGKEFAIWTNVVRLEQHPGANAAFVLQLLPESTVTGSDVQLHELHERVERNLAASPLAVVEWDTRGRVTRWNDSAERIFGWTSAEMLGHNFFPRIIPDIAAEQVKEVVLALLRGEFANARNANITKSGKLITCQWYNSLLRDEHGHVVAVISQAEDVTAEEVAKHKLQESETLLATIIDNLPAAISLKDTRGNHVLVNQVFARWNGKSVGEILQKNDHELWSPELAALRVQGMRAVLASSASCMREEYLSEDVGRECSVIEVPIRDASGRIKGVCSVATDLTEHRRTAKERELLQQQLIDAQKKALRELSTPLMPVADGVLVMPLISNIDEARSALIMETLLGGITQHSATIAIVDVTGVQTIDAATANAILNAARAVKLLGADVILTGLRPIVARTLVEIGANLEGLVSLGTLRAGIAYALRARRLQGKSAGH